ncbi:hypothetical protein FSP39_017690 [Pinctada imbricata]|uniref:1-alkyl-2-acetylglycerophosphocholine esterase n=1 Tax=Pinctada imbricata TaxID=66713 RepID=A0AA89BT84_PINIB|nr:hypothetical protein FSP39_017690 [Pinctada imbricata]
MDLHVNILYDSITNTLKRRPSLNLKLFKSRNNSKEGKVRRHVPVGTGEYTVGCFDVMCDPSHSGSFFRLFYPTTKTDILKRDKQWPLWMPRKQYGQGLADFLGRNPKVFGKVFNWMGGDVYVPALWQGPICPSNNKFPVVIFSHGLGGNRTVNTTICCELASQGFIVAAVEHRDGSASMTYHLKENIDRNSVMEIDEDNSPRRHTIHRTHLYSENWIPYQRIEPLDDFQFRNKQVHHRAEECIKALDVLFALNNGDEVHNSMLGAHFNIKQFVNRLDLSRVSVMGHSFGGSTSLCTLSRDQRFKVGVVLDGWMHPLDEEIYKNVNQPVLMINMDTFQWKENVLQMFKFNKKDVEQKVITIKGTCHQSVTDFQFLVNKALGRILDVRYTLSPKIAIDVCNKAYLGFLWKHLNIPNKDLHREILYDDHDLVIQGTNVDLT